MQDYYPSTLTILTYMTWTKHFTQRAFTLLHEVSHRLPCWMPQAQPVPKGRPPNKPLKGLLWVFGKKNTLRCALVRDFFQDLEDDLKSNRYRWILIWCCWILGDFFETRLEPFGIEHTTFVDVFQPCELFKALCWLQERLESCGKTLCQENPKVPAVCSCPEVVVVDCCRISLTKVHKRHTPFQGGEDRTSYVEKRLH